MNWPSLLIGAAVGSAVTASLYALCRKPAEPTSNEKLDHIANLITEQGVHMEQALAEIATEVAALKGAVASSTALLAALADQIEATAGNEAAARELAAAIRTETASLSAAVAANDGDPNT